MALTDFQPGNLDDIYQKCMHCGLCLPTCPTYNITLREESSPRGRIYLINSVRNKEIKISPLFADEMYFCLDCRACETACPAGVRFGELIEETRFMIAGEGEEPFGFKLFKKLFLRFILTSPSRLKTAARLIRLYQRSGLQDAVEGAKLLKLFSDELHEKHRLLPRIDAVFFDEELKCEVISPANGCRGRVAFLTGCLMNVSFAGVHKDSVAVLLANGFEVVVPKAQVCCGSLHAHNGEIEIARSLARKNIEVFEKYEFDVLVVDSAGCGAFMKDYGRILKDDQNYSARAETISKKVKDISEFLMTAGLRRKSNKLKKKVTYHEACHLVHAQKITDQPRRLIQSIPGIEFIDLPEAAWCCGSAGIYNIVRYEDSMKILERKMTNLKSTGADIVVTANPGCHLQLLYGIAKECLDMEVIHPVTLLARSYHDPS